jgi:hypothetical protein
MVGGDFPDTNRPAGLNQSFRLRCEFRLLDALPNILFISPIQKLIKLEAKRLSNPLEGRLASHLEQAW